MSEIANDKDLYHVAVKLLLRDDDNLLLIHDIFGAWDIPGGRIKPDEFETPLEDIIERKMREELGDNIRYKLGSPKVFFRVEREEHGLNGQKVRIFGIGFEADYLGGEVQLGDHHDQLYWMDIKVDNPAKYLAGGWLVGMQKYLSELNY